ncbi:MAG: hypothetical protein HQ536_03640 [Parcubacteria group bacterium]|nr:hypothetical protein [Parcubacteria group bacterium]
MPRPSQQTSEEAAAEALEMEEERRQADEEASGLFQEQELLATAEEQGLENFTREDAAKLVRFIHEEGHRYNSNDHG